MAEQTWTIRELAAEYDVTLRTIRHYEALGLLSPERRGTTRVFHQRDRIRLELVLRGRRLGFSLDEIARIVNMYDDQPGEAGPAPVPPRPDPESVARSWPGCGPTSTRPRRDLDAVEARCREDLARLR